MFILKSPAAVLHFSICKCGRFKNWTHVPRFVLQPLYHLSRARYEITRTARPSSCACSTQTDTVHSVPVTKATSDPTSAQFQRSQAVLILGTHNKYIHVTYASPSYRVVISCGCNHINQFRLGPQAVSGFTQPLFHLFHH